MGLAVAAASTHPGNARASADNDLATAENAYAGLDYAGALAGAEHILSEAGIDHDTLARATRVAGLSSAALGKTEAARQYFTSLLEYDPTFKVDSKLGPRFAEPFAEARGFWQSQSIKPGLDVQLSVPYGQAGRVRYVTHDPLNIVKRVAVAYRWVPGRDYTLVQGSPGEKDVETEPSSNGATRFEYYVRALDGQDRAIFEEGRPGAPKSIIVEIPREPAVAGAQENKKSVFASPLFWVGTGVVVAAAVVGGYFLFRPTDYTSSGRTRATFGASCGNTTCD